MAARNAKIVSVALPGIMSAVLTGVVPVFATHDRGIVDFEWHVWSRDPADGHLGHLSCDSDSDYCALKIKTMGSIQSIPQSQISREVDAVERHFDSPGKKMSIDRVSVADSMEEYSLQMDTPGMTEYELHCTDSILFWCTGRDMHFEKMTVRINNSAGDVRFGLSENAYAEPPIRDVRKTLGYELFHARGIGHNPDSTVYYQHDFGPRGYEATGADIDDLEGRYS